ncbi:hypothetical protein LGL73_14270, partial [Staphylococcus aureus]|uniref:hypothetical protein n=1 Tax=Staphylococcus aureus TaxID=1280 RepID=UPI001CF42B64
SQSGTDYEPDNYLGAYKLFFGTPTSLEDMCKLGSKEESIPYALGGQNLLTGTGNYTVTGTGARVHGYLSNDDLLNLFKGLEGQTVTV